MTTLNITQVNTTKDETPDTDGLAPGMDPELAPLYGKIFPIRFSGFFFAMNANVTFTRPGRLLLPLKSHLVMQDARNYTIYLIDRASDMSLGCLMKAHVNFKREMVLPPQEIIPANKVCECLCHQNLG